MNTPHQSFHLDVHLAICPCLCKHLQAIVFPIRASAGSLHIKGPTTLGSCRFGDGSVVPPGRLLGWFSDLVAVVISGSFFEEVKPPRGKPSTLESVRVCFLGYPIQTKPIVEQVILGYEWLTTSAK